METLRPRHAPRRPRRRRARRARQPLRGDRAHDDEHAVAHRAAPACSTRRGISPAASSPPPTSCWRWPRASRSTSSRGADLMARAMAESHPTTAAGRRVPAQLALPRQLARRRPHDPRAGDRRRTAPPLHGARQGPPGRLRQRAADHLHGAARDVYEEGALIFPCGPGPARLPRHRGRDPHVRDAHPRARSVARRLPGAARRRADRRGGAGRARRRARLGRARCAYRATGSTTASSG